MTAEQGSTGKPRLLLSTFFTRSIQLEGVGSLLAGLAERVWRVFQHFPPAVARQRFEQQYCREVFIERFEQLCRAR